MTVPAASLRYSRPAARAWTGSDPGTDALDFHRSMPDYRPTPLRAAPALAAELGVAQLLVKDESERLGLPAFKILGASWAVNRAICAFRDRPPAGSFAELRSLVRGLDPVTLVTATDGNHGRAVARMARLLELPARIYLPAGVGPAALQGIRSEGAELVQCAGRYDEAVRRAADSTLGRPAEILVQDTSWPGYEQIPRWIVAGYQTLFAELDRQLAAAAGRPADLLLVPTGVGSVLQAAVEAYRRPDLVGRPSVAAVEPVTSACVTRSLLAGRPISVDTSAPIAMAGLNCGTVSMIAWPILRAGLDAAVTVTEAECLSAAEDLGRIGISSGASGAASLAGARALCADPVARTACGVDETSVVVLLNTEAAF